MGLLKQSYVDPTRRVIELEREVEDLRAKVRRMEHRVTIARAAVKQGIDSAGLDDGAMFRAALADLDSALRA